MGAIHGPEPGRPAVYCLRPDNFAQGSHQQATSKPPVSLRVATGMENGKKARNSAGLLPQ